MSTPTSEPEPRLALPPSPATPPAFLKSPGLAFFLSFLFPGIGQVYNGQPAKALAFFFGLVGSVYAVIVINPLPFAFFIPFVYLYNLVDAWRTATLINTKGAGAAVEDPAESPAWGASLIFVGLLFLLNNLHILNLARIAEYWPALLIVAGGIILYRSVRKGAEPPKTEPVKGDDTAL